MVAMVTRLLVSVLLALGLTSVAEAAPKGGTLALAIVNPGGPEAGTEGDKLARELAAHLASAAGLEGVELVAAYFTTNDAAAAYVKQHKDAFVLGGLGFFLSQRKALKLIPLARLTGASGSSEEFAVVVRKGRYGSLDALRGKSLAGSVLADDARYVDRFAFGGKLAAKAWFVCTPTARPLSALRKVAAGEGDAVLLNRAQHEALAATPLGAQLEVIHRSGPLPTVGLMMAATPRTQAARERIVQAVTKLCGTDKGAPVCRTYGITGFEPLGEKDLADAIATYDRR